MFTVPFLGLLQVGNEVLDSLLHNLDSKASVTQCNFHDTKSAELHFVSWFACLVWAQDLAV